MNVKILKLGCGLKGMGAGLGTGISANPNSSLPEPGFSKQPPCPTASSGVWAPLAPPQLPGAGNRLGLERGAHRLRSPGTLRARMSMDAAGCQGTMCESCRFPSLLIIAADKDGH